jgi:hypothetical protein
VHCICLALSFPFLCLQGILYEDTYLQVGLQSRYTRSNSELLLFLGNKHASSALTGLALLLSGPNPAVQVAIGQMPPQLAPKQQVQVQGWLLSKLSRPDGQALVLCLVCYHLLASMRCMVCQAQLDAQAACHFFCLRRELIFIVPPCACCVVPAGCGACDVPALIPRSPARAAALQLWGAPGGAGAAASAGATQVHAA